MSALSISPSYPIFTNRQGEPLENGYIWIGTVNIDPQVNPISVYWDAGLTQLAVQPIRTLNGYPSNSGTPARLYVNSDYSIRVQDKKGALVYNAPASTDRFGGGIVDASSVVYTPAGTDSVPTTVESRLDYLVHISNFGGSPTATATQNATALSLAITYAVSAGKGGVEIGPGGVWPMQAGVNFATRDIAIVGSGKPILDYSAGTGAGFVLDAGGSGSFVRGMRVENFIIKGGPSITDIHYQRGIAASQFTNIEVREGTNTGFALHFAVLNTYKDCRVSNDSLAMTTTPLHYWKIDNDGTSGNRSQANTFINCDASGKGATSTSDGWRLIDSTLNTWIGGTAESCSKGINIANDQCRLNTFIGMDLEDNQVNDLVVLGTGNKFDGCLFVSTSSGPNISNQTGEGTVFTGGYIRWINLDNTSSDTSFIGCGIDENLSGTLGIQGTGTYTNFACTKIDSSGRVSGTLPDKFQDILVANTSVTTPQFISNAGSAGKPSFKATGNTVVITGSNTPLFSAAFSGFWIARDSTSGGIACGTCDTGVPEVTVISNTIPATVDFSLVGSILNARTTAGTATRTLAVTATAVVGG